MQTIILLPLSPVNVRIPSSHGAPARSENRLSRAVLSRPHSQDARSDQADVAGTGARDDLRRSRVRSGRQELVGADRSPPARSGKTWPPLPVPHPKDRIVPAPRLLPLGFTSTTPALRRSIPAWWPSCDRFSRVESATRRRPTRSDWKRGRHWTA